MKFAGGETEACNIKTLGGKRYGKKSVIYTIDRNSRGDKRHIGRW